MTVIRKRARYVLMRPFWTLLIVEAIGVLRFVTAFGPAFSIQVWSSSRLAMVLAISRDRSGVYR